MAIMLTINGTTTLDESAGLQVPPTVATSTEDNNDNDVLLSTLQSTVSAFYNRLFTAGGLNLSTSFPAANGVAQSASNFISLSGTGNITGLGFVNGSGGPLPVYAGIPASGLATSLTAVNGGAIKLFQDAALGNRMVLGVDTQGDVVFAIYMQPNATLTQAAVWMVQLEALTHSNPANHDDAVNLFDNLGVAASASTEFSFDALPSGQNLFGIVGDAASGLVVIGKTPVLNADGTFTNASNTINTSQGGGPTTIGINNQMFDPGDGAYFTFVKNPDPNVTGAALDSNEADDADNIQFGERIEVTGGFLKIAQIQGGSPASLKIKAFDGNNTLDGKAFADTGLGTGSVVVITKIVVKNAGGTIVQTLNNPVANGDGSYTVSNLGAGFRIEWTTTAVHDQVLIEGVAGKFDIGGFGVDEASAASVDIGDKLRFEDDGPSIIGSAMGAPTLTVDETVLATNATGNFATQFTPTYGADGAGATPVSYALSTPGGLSGLVDTATGQAVVLSVVAGVVYGRTQTSNELVFTVSVSGGGVVTLDQIRAVVHPNTANPDDAKTLSAANLVVLTATATDKDGDSASTPLNIGQQLVFEDDGPSIIGSVAGAPTLTVDETVLATNATGDFAAQFTPTYGADGAGATPVSYALSTPGGLSGLVDTATGQAVVLSVVAGVVYGRTQTSNELVFTVSVSASGVVTLDQIRAVVHPNTANPDDAKTLSAANLVVLTATATDKDGDSASTPLNIGQQLVFEDDGPSIIGSAAGAPTLTVDETVLATNATGDFAAQFTPTYGADGAGATPVSYALSTPGGASGLVDTATGQAVVLSVVAGVVYGRTQTSNELVFTVSVSASGVVTLDQIRAVVHPTADPDESKTLSAANLVVLTATATDKDGDSASTPLNIGQQLVFKDDGPSIGDIPDGLVDFAAASSVTKTLNGDVGADPKTNPYTLTDWTGKDAGDPAIIVNDVTLKSVPNATGGNPVTAVSYWADTNADTIFGNAGDTEYYRLTLGNQAGAGNYTFTVLVDPPPAFIPFSFNALPSGQNLFGTVGQAGSALVVIGKDPVLNANGDGTFTNASDTINTSQGGGPTTIGVDNQMFDPGDGAYFTYVKSPNPNYLAGAVNGLDQNEADDADNIQYSDGNGATNDTIEANAAYVLISQTQGNSPASLSIQAYNMDGNPQGQAFVDALGEGAHSNVVQVKVSNAAGTVIEDTGDPAVNSAAIGVTFSGGVATVTGLRAGYKVEWITSSLHDQVLITGEGGKFDIGGFGLSQAQPTPDQLLTFTAKVVDGDGDSDLDTWNIGIDGTGIHDNGVVANVASSSLAALRTQFIATDQDQYFNHLVLSSHSDYLLSSW